MFDLSPLLQRFGHHGDNYLAKVISKNNFLQVHNNTKV
jgi:hypothetical protein